MLSMFRRPTRQLPPARRPALRPRLETLDDRDLLSAGVTAAFDNGVLTVYGTEGADEIYLAQIDGILSIEGTLIDSGGTDLFELDAAYVDAIQIYGYGGDDYIACDSEYYDGQEAIEAPITVDAGSGNDKVWGSDGDDTFYGRGGDDRLNGNAGNDSLYGGGGGNDVLKGNGGSNYLSGSKGTDTIKGYLSDTVVAGTGNDTINLTIYVSDVIDYEYAPTVNLTDYVNTDAGTDTFNLKLNAGDFAEEFLNPLIDELHAAMDYFAPLIDMLDSQVPALSELYSDGFTFADFVSYAGDVDLDPFLDTYHAISALEATDLNGTVDMGTFSLSGVTVGTPKFVTQRKADVFAQFADPVLDELHELEATYLRLFERAKSAMDMVLGTPITLFEFEMPYFYAEVSYGDEFSWPTSIPFVSVEAGFDATLTFEAGGETFGLDTSGLLDGGDLWDGFYVENPGATVDLTVTGYGGAAVGVNNLFELGSAGVYGSVGGAVYIELEDSDGDGRVYLWEIDSLDGSVNATGEISYDIGVYVQYLNIDPFYGAFGEWETNYDSITSGSITL